MVGGAIGGVACILILVVPVLCYVYTKKKVAPRQYNVQFTQGNGSNGASPQRTEDVRIVSVSQLAAQTPTYAPPLSLDDARIASCPPRAHPGSNGVPAQPHHGAAMMVSFPPQCLPVHGRQGSFDELGEDVNMAYCTPQVHSRYTSLLKAESGAQPAKFIKEAEEEAEEEEEEEEEAFSEEFDDDEANIYTNLDEEEGVKGVFPCEEVEYANTASAVTPD